MLLRLRHALELLLAAFTVILLLALAGLVVVAVILRKLGMPLVWYDEVAVILLAWLTYYGTALACLRRAHLGFPELIEALPRSWRLAAVVLAEACVVGFFALLAWTGWRVLAVLEGTTLVSLDWVPVTLTQSVIPIAASLAILAQLLTLPEMLARAWAGRRLSHAAEEEGEALPKRQPAATSAGESRA
jgi:TRAP-type C4-dicarboxylate transport system permease small subunit